MDARRLLPELLERLRQRCAWMPPVVMLLDVHAQRS
jgi:hypothetical protein